MDPETVLAELVNEALSAGPPAMFLDFDGTIVELADTPDAVQPSEALVSMLTALAVELDGALAIVTGRPIAVVDHFLQPLRLPVAGLHGMEIRADPDGKAGAPRAIELDHVRQGVADLPARVPGIQIEDKGATLAIHYRAVPGQGPAIRAIATLLRQQSKSPLTLIDGKMVIELMPAGIDKGVGINTLLRDRPFVGRKPIFFGDDVTDEAGFGAVNALGGLAVRVGSASTPTLAPHHVGSVDGVLRFLEIMLDRLIGRR